MSEVIFPPPIQPGDTVAVVAPASPSEENAAAEGIALLKKRYKVKLADNLTTRRGYLAGEDAHRADELNRILNDDDIRAIFAARGGYGTSRIIDRLDFRKFERSPKWIAGCSDLTVLSAHLLARLSVASVHGPMVSGFHRTDERDVTALFALVEGAPRLDDTFPLSPVFPGTAEGPLVGGNLTVLAHLAGALPKDFLKGAIVFLEDVSEQPYRLDRCLTQLSRAGMLDDISAIVLGELTDCRAAPNGVEAFDVFKEFIFKTKLPAATGWPAAHGKRNAPFIQGAPARLEVMDSDAKLSFL